MSDLSLVEKVRLAQFLAHADLGGIRRAAKVTQKDVAAELGVHPTTVVWWEAKKHRPRGELAVRYAALLRTLEAEAER